MFALERRCRGDARESFLRVHWVAVPKASRARRVNRCDRGRDAARLVRRAHAAEAGGGADSPPPAAGDAININSGPAVSSPIMSAPPSATRQQLEFDATTSVHRYR
eukprot:COSAG01_NODE_20438_length_953_cov_1.142857_2_plen_106_part_00